MGGNAVRARACPFAIPKVPDSEMASSSANATSAAADLDATNAGADLEARLYSCDFLFRDNPYLEIEFRVTFPI